eukprot:PhF_6_TR43013/c0_g1_i1/m.65735
MLCFSSHFSFLCRTVGVITRSPLHTHHFNETQTSASNVLSSTFNMFCSPLPFPLSTCMDLTLSVCWCAALLPVWLCSWSITTALLAHTTTSTNCEALSILELP